MISEKRRSRFRKRSWRRSTHVQPLDGAVCRVTVLILANVGRIYDHRTGYYITTRPLIAAQNIACSCFLPGELSLTDAFRFEAARRFAAAGDDTSGVV